jgi:hypothetical protein
VVVAVVVVVVEAVVVVVVEEERGGSGWRNRRVLTESLEAGLVWVWVSFWV